MSTSKPLVLADKEHYSQELFQAVGQQGCFDLLCALPAYPECWKRWSKIPPPHFAPRWPGYATATEPYHFKNDPQALYHELVQRSGVKKEDLQYQGFLSTVLRPEVQALTQEYPQRWQVEEFFKFNQAMGWHRTGTLNLNVRYAQLTMALLAQAAVHQLRQRLGPPVADLGRHPSGTESLRWPGGRPASPRRHHCDNPLQCPQRGTVAQPL